MPTLSTLKDHFREGRLYFNRAIAASVFVLTLTVVLLTRLIYLQVSCHDLYTTLSRNNQIRVIPIPPNRGLIFDRNGTLLAENVPAFSLEIIPERIANLPETLQALGQIIPITPADLQTFHKQVRHKRRSEAIPLRLKLTEEEVAAFSTEQYRFPGVEVKARLIRHYPHGDLLAHALGYIGPISERDLETIDESNYSGTYHIGKSGVEKFYETQLHGKVGYQYVETDAHGREVRVLGRHAPVPGDNLHLALDIRLQRAAEQALGDRKGAVVAIDPQTGHVLAMVSKPSFDPNHFAQGIQVHLYKELQDSPERPLFNRALRGQYPPASTVKPLVSIQALEQGAVTTSHRIFDPGWFQLNHGDRFYRDWKRHGHGWTDLEKAIVESCDTYFFGLAHKMGIQSLHDIYSRFGLGQMTGIDTVGEIQGLVPSKDWKRQAKNEVWFPGETLNVGIGQGYLLSTPLQIAKMAATIATRGQPHKPRMVLAIETFGQAVKPVPLAPEAPIQLRSNQNWRFVIQAMQKVVHAINGTAHRIASGMHYQVAGKTGTAQVFSLKQNERYEKDRVQAHLRDHSWFMCFAPLQKPQIAVSVLVENSGGGPEVAREVLDVFFEEESDEPQS